MLKRVERVLCLAGRHYVTSLALWLFTATPMVGGLLFTELAGPWSPENMVWVLLAGAAGHLALGVVLIVARFLLSSPAVTSENFGWWVAGTLVIAGGVRGLTIGMVVGATGVGEFDGALRVSTSVALVGISFPLIAYSLQLWADYRQKRHELLLSLFVSDANNTHREEVSSGFNGGGVDDVRLGIESAQARTLATIGAIRRAIVSGGSQEGSVHSVLDSTDSAWRDTSHIVWDRGLPKIPRITFTELLRTSSVSKPFSSLVLLTGPLYGFARALETTSSPERWLVFGIWSVGAVAIGVTANTVAGKVGAFGPAVLVAALLGIQAVPVSLGHLIGGDSTLLLQLWFVGFVSSTISLVFGFPPALERHGQRVIDQLEKWVDKATLEAVRAQGEHFIASQRLAHYLHSEIRGHFLRLSMALRQAMYNQDQKEALSVLDDLQALVTELSLQAPAVSPQKNVQEFLANWARMVDLTHNLDTVSLPLSVAIASEAIVMEAVNDAVRHSQASQVDVKISQDADVYSLVISSDGHSPPSAFSPGLGTRILNTYAPGRWSRETHGSGGQSLRVELSALLPQPSP